MPTVDEQLEEILTPERVKEIKDSFKTPQVTGAQTLTFSYEDASGYTHYHQVIGSSAQFVLEEKFWRLYAFDIDQQAWDYFDLPWLRFD